MLVPMDVDRSNVLIYLVQYRFRLGVALWNEYGDSFNVSLESNLDCEYSDYTRQRDPRNEHPALPVNAAPQTKCQDISGTQWTVKAILHYTRHVGSIVSSAIFSSQLLPNYSRCRPLIRASQFSEASRSDFETPGPPTRFNRIYEV